MDLGRLSSFTIFNKLGNIFDVLNLLLEPTIILRLLEDKFGEFLHHLDLSRGRTLLCEFSIGLSKSVSAVALGVTSPSFPPSCSSAFFVASVSLLRLSSTVGPVPTNSGNSLHVSRMSLLCSSCDRFSVLPNFAEGFGGHDGLDLSLFLSLYLGFVFDGDGGCHGGHDDDGE